MSAIWGILKTDNSTIDKSIPKSMSECMNKYKIDRIDDIFTPQVYFACGHQHLTLEAVNEILPYYDKERDIYFTADCIIDNRNELIAELYISDCSTPDGMLSYQAYLKWGEDFIDHLIGVFSFAIYEKRSNTFLLYTDHMGSRCINYSIQDHSIFFSTTYDLFKETFPPDQLQLSEKWITGYEAEPSACMITFPGLTPFEKVFQLKAAHYIKYSNGRLSEKQYWNPKKCPKIRFSKESEYKQLLIDTFSKCVEDLLRPGTKIAATLSGGLDSSSVVSFAAPMLENRGEKLYTYTSIPDCKKDLDIDEYYVPDESDAVKKTAACFSNIECNYIDCKGESALTHLRQFVSEYAVPLKSSINLLWIDAISNAARENGCTIKLTGQHGNSTISYGDIFSLAYQQVVSLHISQAKDSVKAFLKKNHVHKNNFVHVMNAAIVERINAFIGRDTGISYSDTYTKKELIKKYHIKYYNCQRIRKYGNGTMLSNSQRRSIPFQLAELQQLSIYNTMDSLINGIIERDPTRDKRIIELCIAFPMSCYVAHGTERYMVRGYLKEIVPNHITCDVRHRGLQAADYINRINHTWLKDRQSVIDALNNPMLSTYLNDTKITAMIEKCKNKDSFTRQDDTFVIYMLYIVSLSYFLSQFSQS